MIASVGQCRTKSPSAEHQSTISVFAYAFPRESIPITSGANDAQKPHPVQRSRSTDRRYSARGYTPPFAARHWGGGGGGGGGARYPSAITSVVCEKLSQPTCPRRGRI